MQSYCSGQAAPSAAEMPALSGEVSELSDMPAGSFWMQPGAQPVKLGMPLVGHWQQEIGDGKQMQEGHVRGRARAGAEVPMFFLLVR